MRFLNITERKSFRNKNFVTIGNGNIFYRELRYSHQLLFQLRRMLTSTAMVAQAAAVVLHAEAHAAVVVDVVGISYSLSRTPNDQPGAVSVTASNSDNVVRKKVNNFFLFENMN